MDGMVLAAAFSCSNFPCFADTQKLGSIPGWWCVGLAVAGGTGGFGKEECPGDGVRCKALGWPCTSSFCPEAAPAARGPGQQRVSGFCSRSSEVPGFPAILAPQDGAGTRQTLPAEPGGSSASFLPPLAAPWHRQNSTGAGAERGLIHLCRVCMVPADPAFSLTQGALADSSKSIGNIAAGTAQDGPLLLQP